MATSRSGKKQNQKLQKHLQKLISFGVKIREMSPWEYMADSEVFAIRDTQSDTLFFVSVMGNAGIHYAISFNIGYNGLYRFLQLAEKIPCDEKKEDMVLLQETIQVIFVPRSMLTKKDKSLAEEFDFKRGDKFIPQIRKYTEGSFDQPINIEEAKAVINVFPAVIQFLSGYLGSGRRLNPLDTGKYLLLHTPKDKSAELTIGTLTLKPQNFKPLDYELNTSVLKELKKLPQNSMILEADYYFSKMLIGVKGDSYIPRIVLIVDSDSFFILGKHLCKLGEDPNSTLLEVVIDVILDVGHRPKKIRVRRDVIFDTLRMLEEKANVKIVNEKPLKAINKVKRDLEKLSMRF